MSETYRIDVFCTNCGYSGQKDVPKGQQKPEGATCPNCGCHTLSSGFSRCSRNY